MGCSSSQPTIVVKKKLIVSLGTYKNAFVDVQNDAYNTLMEKRLGNDVVAVDLDISSLLRKFNINPRSNEKEADLKVVCHFIDGLGLPRIIRHFNIKTTYITKVNIILIDVASGSVVGEVSYKRPFTKTNKQVCPEGFVKKMFGELLATGTREQPGNNRDAPNFLIPEK